MKRLLVVLVLFAAPAWAQKPTVIISGDGSATVVSVGTQGPAGGSVSATATIEYKTSDGTVAGVYPLKTLTEGVATPVILIALGGSGASAGGVFEYSIFVADATPNYQVRHGSFNFAATNKGGTETCTIGATDETKDGSVLVKSSGGADTLTYAITCDTSPPNGVYISFNVTSSLTQTSLTIKPRINLDCSAALACSVWPQ